MTGSSALHGSRRPAGCRSRGRPLRIGELPAAAQGAVELDQGRQPVVARLGEQDLGREELLLGLEHLQVVREAGHVAHVREPHRLPVGGHLARPLPSPPRRTSGRPPGPSRPRRRRWSRSARRAPAPAPSGPRPRGTARAGAGPGRPGSGGRRRSTRSAPPEKSCEICGATPPRAPVRLMRGKKSALATPTLGVGRDQVLLGLAQVGPPLGAGPRAARAGTSGGRNWSLSAAPRGIGPGLRPSRKDSWFSCATICRSRSGMLAAVEASSASALAVSRAEAAPPWRRRSNRSKVSWNAPDGAAGDLELEVELAELEVVGGDLGDQREEDPAPRLLRGQVLRQGRLVRAPDAAPEVELPGGVDVELQSGSPVAARTAGRAPPQPAPGTPGRPASATIPALARASSTRQAASRTS